MNKPVQLWVQLYFFFPKAKPVVTKVVVWALGRPLSSLYPFCDMQDHTIAG